MSGSATFYIKRGDLLPVISVTPTDGDGIAVPVPDGATVVFNMRPANRNSVTVNRAPATALGGVLTYAWVAGDTDTAGVHYAEWEWDNGGKPETFPNYAAGRLLIQIAEDIA